MGFADDNGYDGHDFLEDDDCDKCALLQDVINKKDEALVYAIRFLDPKVCDRDFVKQALKEGK